MTEELYKRHRPTKFSELVGQDSAVKELTAMGRNNAIPHFLLFIGPSGCGKTTIARILKNKLKCSDADFKEMNAAKDRGIDMVREIDSRVGLAPMAGPCRIWLIDECHQMTAQAMESILKLLEDTPKHAYFFLCTTDPSKLKRTIVTRATKVKVVLIGDKEMTGLVNRVAAAEKKQIEEDVVAKIVSVAEGSARMALVLLHQVIDLATEEDKLEALERESAQRSGFELAQALVRNAKWPEIAAILGNCEDDPETVRRIVLGYFTKVALGQKTPKRAVGIIEAFLDPYFNTGKAGLVQSCAVVCFGGV